MMENKLSSIIESIIYSKQRYIEVKSPNGEPFCKLMLEYNSKEFVALLDMFFDSGYKIEEISKEDFDSFSGDTHNFNY